MADTTPILYFTPDAPGALWQDKPQIARRLAKRRPVVMAGPELHLRGLARQRQAGHWSLADLWRPPLSLVAENLYRFTWPPWAPLTGAPLLGRRTAQLRRRRWQQVLAQWGDNRPILWLFRPGMLPYVDQFDARLVIYHVVDEYSAYPGLTAAQAARQRELDAALTRRADLVFCTAQSLANARQRLNPRTYYLPNAVDYLAFQAARSALLPHRDSIADIVRVVGTTRRASKERPILGFVGGINAKLDVDLLAQVATARQDWLLVLVGPLGYGLDEGGLTRLRSLGNVYLAEPVAPELVPATIDALDVCLIPYRLNEQTRHVNPLKLYEYLAAGKPVVATPLPELAQFPGLVRLSGDAAGFEAAIQASLAEVGDPLAQATRRAFAAANTWDQRVARMETLIEEALSTGRDRSGGDAEGRPAPGTTVGPVAGAPNAAITRQQTGRRNLRPRLLDAHTLPGYTES